MSEPVRTVGDRYAVSVDLSRQRPTVEIRDAWSGRSVIVPIDHAVDIARAIERAVDRIVEHECSRGAA